MHRHSLWSRVWPPPLRGGEAHPHTAGCGGTLPVRVEGRGDGQRAACSLPLGFSGGDGTRASTAAVCGSGGGQRVGGYAGGPAGEGVGGAGGC